MLSATEIGGCAMEVRRPASLMEYLKCFCNEWTAGMTGQLSIVLTVIAIWLDNEYAKTGFSISAVLCALFGSYRI